MSPDVHRYYEASTWWATARRRYFGDGSSFPRGPRHLGWQVTATFVEDLHALGWKAAVLLDEENTR